VKGTGDPGYTRDVIDEIYDVSAERDFWAEMMNWPLDPAKAVFRQEDFQIVPFERAPIEIRAGLGHAVTDDELHELMQANRKVRSFVHCDPAGKEQQSKLGDDTAIVGLRQDNEGGLWAVYLRAGQWTSDRVWDELYLAHCYVRGDFVDYESPSSELHLHNSLDHWESRRSIEAGEPVRLPVKFDHLPKTSKASRVEQLQLFTKHKKFHILSNAADPKEIDKFIGQFTGWLVTTHDDYPDAASRVLRFVQAPTFRRAQEITEKPASTRVDANGVTKVKVSALLNKLKVKPSGGGNWGVRGKVA
jgi:hypothetical protein